MSKIHSDLLELRKIVGNLKAEKVGGVSFPVKSAKDLMEKLRPALDKLGMLASPIAIEYSVDRVPTDRGANTLVTAKTTVRFMSDDGSHMDFVGFGQGGDTQDKAAGKASTYAWKDCVVKALSLPDAEMVDADDEETPFIPKKVDFKTVVNALNNAKTSKELTDAKTLASKGKWSPDETRQLQDVFTRVKGTVK